MNSGNASFSVLFCFPAYNGSLISSLTTPQLDRPLDTIRALLANAEDLTILTQKNTAAEQFMQTTSNRALKKLQQISDSQSHNKDSVEASMEAVLNTPNTVFFQDLALFSLLKNPPSGPGIGTVLIIYQDIVHDSMIKKCENNEANLS